MRRLALLLAAFCTVLITGGCPSANHDQVSTPAYRPQSPHAARFVETIGSSRITVYPTIVRTPSETAYSIDSQRQIVAFLGQQVTTSAVSASRRLAPGAHNSPPQWDIFVADLARIGDQLKATPTATGYHLVLEVIFPPNSPSVWGIHCFVLDHQGNNAFSFLLNSHHALFQAGALATPDPSDAARDRLVANATRVALKALERQLEAPADDTAADDPGY